MTHLTPIKDAIRIFTEAKGCRYLGCKMSGGLRLYVFEHQNGGLEYRCTKDLRGAVTLFA